jgi:hypothetical protein
MPHDTFDFAFVQQSWTWSHRVGERIVDSSTRAFATLNECIADARKAGFHAEDRAGGADPAGTRGMLVGGNGTVSER